MKIKINNVEYEANLGETILDVCRREKVRIPTLCAHGKLKREAACRLCLVETNRSEKLLTACTFQVCEGLEVVTESERIKKAREINMELLWSDHAGKCINCRKNRRCELQKLAEEYKIENFHFVPRREEITTREELDLVKDNKTRMVVDDKNSAIFRTTEFCVECRRCINICPIKAYGFNNRAGEVVVGTPYNQKLDCLFCGACVKHCPTGALTDQNDLDQIIQDINNLRLMPVVMVDPAVMESIQSEFPGVDSMDKLIGLLRKLGFEKVFDARWGMDQYINQLADEVYPKEKLFNKNKPKNKLIINSNCPAYTRFIDKFYPELGINISKVELPEEIMAAAIRSDFAKAQKVDQENILIIALSSCVAKKATKSRDINYYLTVRELGRLARKKSLDEKGVKDSNFDKFISFYDEKAVSMTKTGGTLELLKEKTKQEKNDKMIAINSLEEAKSILDKVRKREAEYEFIELMICPGGCVNGGGQSLKI